MSKISSPIEKWTAYPSYRDTKIEWLGEIPKSWEMWKITHGFKHVGSGTTPKSDRSEYYDGEIAWVTTSELRESIINNTTKKISKYALQEYTSLKIYPPGTLLLAMYGATVGRLGILGIYATVNQACIAFSNPNSLRTKFTYYWLWSQRSILISFSTGGGQPNLSQDNLKLLRVPAPSLKEQQVIENFLDQETKKIDQLIEKKKQFIKLLKEKRQVLITHTVTKGIPAKYAKKMGAPVHTQFRSSRVEWLKTIPKNWNSLPIKFVTILVGRIGFRGYTTDDLVHEGEGAISLSPSNMKEGKGVDYDKCVYLSWFKYYESPEIMVEKHDILMVKTGSTYGKVSFVEELNMASTINPQIMIIKKIKISNRFLFYVFLSSAFKNEIRLLNKGSTIPTITQESIENLKVPVPTKNEQKIITTFLDKETGKIDVRDCKA